jgi:glutathione synthase/RimK-type ligase-like ATP-grasp enzyme
MRLWVIIPDEALTDDRAYLIGYLKGVFDEVETSRVVRTASHVPAPERQPHIILNLVGARNRLLLDSIDTLAQYYGIPVSPPSNSAWRTEDKRTYLVDFPDVSPPTRIARNLADVQAALCAFGEIVVKDPFGFRGQGVEKISSEADLSIAERLLNSTVSGSRELVVQPFLAGFTKGDKRVIVQRAPDNSFEIIGYILRKPPPNGWKSNIRCGGRAFRTELTDAEAELALAIAPRTGIDNVTLDIAEHEGRIFYIEHNQGYGGIIDFDLDRGTKIVSRCAEFLLHAARYGHPDQLYSSSPKTLPQQLEGIH